MRTVARSGGIPKGYDKRRIATLILRARLKTVAYCTLCAIPVLIAAYFALDFLARTPRERKIANASYWERLVYGARINGIYLWNWFTAKDDDPKNSALPVMEIYLRKERLSALKAHLPESGRIYQPGLLKVRRKGEPNLVVGANLRFRGDSMNHWSFPERSWRVKLKRNARYLGLRQFNLYLPRTRSQIPDFLGYDLAKKMGGLIVPTAFPVHFRVNRGFAGLRVFLEQIDPEFLSNRQIQADAIFIGDINFRDVYHYNDREQLFNDVNGWEVLSLTKDRKASNAPVQRLIGVLSLASSDAERFKRGIEEILDLKSVLRYMAYLELVASFHADDTHNQRFYLDSESGKLRPIVWDPVAYYREDLTGIDFDPNRLFVALLRFPEYREEKNRYIWEALNGALSSERIEGMIRDAAELITKEVEAAPQKVFTQRSNLDMMPNFEWPDAVSELIKRSQVRNRFLKEALLRISVEAKATQGFNNEAQLELQIGADSGFTVNKLTFACRAACPDRIVIDYSELTPRQEVFSRGTRDLECRQVSPGFCEVDTAITLWSARGVDGYGDIIRHSGNYLWRIKASGNSELSLRSLSGKNSITGEAKLVEAKPKQGELK